MVSTFFLAIKYFLIKVCTLFFRHNAFAHLIDYKLQHSVNITFIFGKPKNWHDSPHCDARFTAVVQDRTCCISEACLHCGLSSLNNRHLSLIVLEARKSKMEVLAYSVPGENPFWLMARYLLAACLHGEERKRALVSLPLLIRTLMPSWGLHPNGLT